MALTTAPADAAQHQTRKKMRKGTHSCLQCRRRKIRCVFSSNSKICNGCISRGTECVDQEYGDGRLSVAEKKKKAREKELGGLISQVLRNMEESGGASSLGESEMTAAEALKRLQSELLPSTITAADVSADRNAMMNSTLSESLNASHSAIHRFEKAPLLSLFENEVLNHKDNDVSQASVPQPAKMDVNQPVIDKSSRVLKAVRALVPNANDLTSILRVSQVWSLQWQKNFPDILEAKCETLKPSQIQSVLDYIYRTLESDNAADVVRILLCLALSLQQLPGDFDFVRLNLPASPEALQDYYLTSVETLLAPDEGFACSCDGLACMLLQARFYVYTGKPRKAWIIFRRAISFAQLLGLHRKLENQAEEFSDQQRSLWLHIWASERYLSLILGLPYATANSEETMKVLTNDTFQLKMGLILGHIIDRNQRPTTMDYPATVKIDQELEDCKKTIPPGWLEAVPSTGLCVGDIYDITTCKFLYHNARKLLHLPFMLKTSTDPRYQFSRLAALESSRAMIEAYQVLRNVERPVITVCNVVDFQAFTAGMIILIDLLGYSQYSSGHDTEQEKKDWEMVDGLTRIFRQISKEKPCSVATQATGVLENLCNARERNPDTSEDVYEAILPYFGKIRIGRGKAFTSRQTAPHQNQQQSQSEYGINPVGVDPYPNTYFDGYLESLPGDPLFWQNIETDWTSTVDFDLRNDWSWSSNDSRLYNQ
ncbi:hypothetical protein MMC07_005605 [Pseudocyphellaria aurata]|nr:hypothetical protein [Pseudocyphellaria aurata]